MKRIISYVLIFAMLAGVGIPMGATVQSKTKTLKLAKKSVTVRAKESVKVKYTSAKKPTVKSKNKKIATAKLKASKKRIVITGVKKGKTKIAVKAYKKTQYIKVTVKKAAKIEDIIGGNNQTPAPTVDPAIKEEIKKAAAYSPSVNNFTYKSFNALRKADDNTFVSPLSLYMALAVLTNGADNNTKAELLKALGIEDLNDFNSKVKGLLGGSGDNNVTLNISNATWLSKNLQVSPTIDKDFVDIIKTYYNSEVKKDMDLSTMAFVNELNKWASDKTNGMIQKVLDNPLDSSTAMVIANAVYFLGKWKMPFDPKSTYKKDFNGVKGKKTIDMMSQHGVYLKYFKDDNFVGAELPYGEGNYVLDILMSADESKVAGNVWTGLSDEAKSKEFENFDTAGSKEINILELPKFEMECSYDDSVIIPMLMNMGINDTFDPAKADFTKIGNAIYVDSIIQKTKLKVYEEGTEAAAVTVIIAKNTSVMPSAEVTNFIVDRPFIFTIRDKLSGMILFMGEVNNL